MPRLLFALVAIFLVAADRPNVVLVLADDLGFSDLGCYGGEIPTPHLDRLAAGGVRFAQFYNCARCCPTRAALLTGRYPHQVGIGHMLGDWKPPAYTAGLAADVPTVADVLKKVGYRTYHVGKWHTGAVTGQPKAGETPNHPLDRGFDRAYGTGGGANYFAPTVLYRDRQPARPGPDYYITDDFTAQAVRQLEEHAKDRPAAPFFLHLCYTAPHFPLHARPADIARHRGRYAGGWDELRAKRFARQKELGLFPNGMPLSPRDPEATAWADVPAADRAEWDRRMATHAAMVENLDRGVGAVVAALEKLGVAENTLVLFLSDNGASAEALDTWPNPARGHKPGSVTGTQDSHRCLEVGWANAANTPFREHKMWVHEGGIRTPLIAHWPKGVPARGTITPAVGHVIDLLPTLADVAGAGAGAVEGRSLRSALRGQAMPAPVLAWEHEGNRALRFRDWKLVAAFNRPWELYDLAADPNELSDKAAEQPDIAKGMAGMWQAWADRVGVVPWGELPGAKYKPDERYRKKSERK